MPEPGRNLEEKAIRVAIAYSLFGSVTKIVAGAVTGSMAMISSAIDSLGDLFVSGANLAAVRYGGQPPDAEHNYGHTKIEGLAAMFRAGSSSPAARSSSTRPSTRPSSARLPTTPSWASPS
jgi:divalent metal cation (Fe/Co/Zn/Cd) transporter